MTQLQVQHIRKEYGDTVILEDISFQVSYGDKIGIVGTNGCGKSTLLRILAGEEQADGGRVLLDKKAVVRMMEQDHFDDVQMKSRSVDSPETGSEQLRDESMYLMMMNMEKEKAQQTDVLSGGERTKLNLSRILAGQANLLILDEPTNNLDVQGIDTFLYLLKEYQGTILMVSHDRYVLDQTVNRIIEIEYGKATVYEGNYTAYREEKQRRREAQMHRYEADRKEQRKLDEAIRQVQNWSEKAHRDSTKKDPSGLKFGVKEKKRAKAKRMDQQVKSNLKRLEKMRSDSAKRPEDEKKVLFSVQKGGKGGRRILEVRELAKAYGSQILFQDSNFFLGRGEKAALTGPNGSGKSTFIRMLMGEEPADAGEIWISPGSDPYILQQTFTELPEQQEVYAYLEEKTGPLKGLERTILHNLGLTRRHLFQTIGSLSFGERMKLKLARPILEKRDFIILDEPTNHLDLFAREQLEETLREYDGTLLVVSHDRYFLEQICDKALLIEEQNIRRMEYLP